jgi:predicted O-linked N-acetylglucosamine transferase (SPINDLY family)
MGGNAGQRAFHNARLRKRHDAEVARLLERALQLHQTGVLADAQAVYRQLLQLAPNHFDALHLLGTLESQAKNFQQAETLLSRAVAADPQSAQAQLNRGVALNGLQRYEEARESYQRAIALRPDYAVALFNLGNVCRTLNRLDEAVESYDKAIAAKADFADAWYNRGLVLSQLSRLAGAIESFDRALAINPRHVDALNDKARALYDADRPLEALENYDRALGINPNLVHVLSNRGNALTALERLDEAIESYDRALAIDRNFTEAHNGRGGVLNQLRNYSEAIASFGRALSIEPDHSAALTNRASAWLQSGQIAEALPDFERAIAIEPDHSAALTNRASAWLQSRRIADALHDCERALAIEPDSFRALSVLGQCLAGLGRVDEAIASFDRALAIKPDSQDAISSKIFTLDFAAGADFARHQQVRRVWWEQIGSKIPAAPAGSHANDRDPRRRLVLGYVSSDFRAHSAARAFKPVLQHHDRTQFEIVCYSCAPIADATTAEFRQMTDRWRDASQWNDARLAEQIRADGIDILIDLSGHSKGNRLGVFARKPAPVQVHGWGHATGTGLPTIDYMFSDPVAVPFEVRHLFAETIVDLPCVLTLEPLPAGIPRAEAPALSNGYVTFGVFNRISKISDQAAGIWAQILNRLPRSRLLIKDGGLDDPQVRDSLLVRFAHCGLASERIDFAGASSRPDHLAAFNRVDICLDPFPQNGGVSTWEALQMGVPVVAKLGNSVGSRAAGAILCALGLPDWVAEDNQAYVEIAATRGARIDDLQRLRCELPGLIAAAAAGDPVRYAQAVDAAYLAMWTDYCQRSAA